jgi:hypothetical protein
MTRWIKWIVTVCVVTGYLTTTAFSQSTTHVFPQIADGFQSDGSSYLSTVFVTNTGLTSASCTLSLYGMDTSRLLPAETIVLPGSSWSYYKTKRQSSLASGYARLNCSQPVHAMLTYQYVSSDQLTVVSAATVFSSPAVQYAMYPVHLPNGMREAVAIVNDNTVSASYKLRYTAGGGGVTESTIQVAAKSQYVGFLDQMLALPPDALTGTLQITSQSGQSFSVVGLLFFGTVFTTLVGAY